MSGLPSRTDVVVIGAGVVGASVAWHLAAAGGVEVLLLERGQVGCGTSWHAAGNMETWRADPLIGEMVAYTVELFPELERQSGVQIGWRQDGRVHYTADPDVMARYRRVPARARARGVEVELLGPAEVGAKLPVLALDGIQGGLWTANDGRVDPTNLAQAYARGAVLRGARLVEGCPVTAITLDGGRVSGVETAQGWVRATAVVLAGGLWSTALARTCRVRLPLMALHHFYLLTEASPAVPRDLPMFLSYDELTYGREDVGGLLLGAFDANAIPIESADLPGDFTFALLDENWEQIAPNLEILQRRFPLLATTGIRTLVNGPESFTPDGNMLLGELGEPKGLHLACGMNSNGIALAAGVGRLTAERVLGLPPSWDAIRLDPRRFQPFQSGDRYRRARMSEIPVWFCRHDDSASATRGLRRSPLHARHLAERAVMEHVAGWERPLWFERSGSPQAELDRALADAVRIDRSADAKLLLIGADQDQVVARLCAAGPAGALTGIVMLDPQATLLLADPGHGGFLRTTLGHARDPDDGLWLRDTDSGWAVLELAGPRVRARVPCLPDQGTRSIELGLAPVIATRTGEQSWRLVISAEMAGHVDAVLAAAGVDIAGELVAETLRILAGRPRFGTDTSPDAETAGGRRRLIGGRVQATAVEPLEPVLRDHATVGWITSAGLPVDGVVPVLALVAGETDGLETLVEGERRPLEI